jgi:hypothetical protein
MLVLVGVAAIVATIRTRQQRAPRSFTLAAVAAAVGVLAWPLLDALDALGVGVGVATIAYVIAPFLFATPLLLLVGKISEARRAFRR